MDIDAAWDELLREGTVARQSVARVPQLLAALEAGTENDAGLLFLLAAISVAQPDSVAAAARAEVAKGAAVIARSLGSDDPDVRAGAVSALVAAQAAEVERVARLADDPDPYVRATAALALGVIGARVAFVERLLEDLDASVRYAAALALQKMSRIDRRVVRTLVRGATTDEGDAATETAPWDVIYPWPHEAAAQLGLQMLESELPTLLDAVGTGAGYSVDVVLELAFGPLKPGAKAKAPTRLTPFQRDVLERLTADGAPWDELENLEEVLARYGLPPKRRDLQRLARSG